MALNKCIIMGRITKDLELRSTTNNVPVVSFSIACDRDRKDQNGEKVTDFIDIVAFRNTAEFCAKYMGKGRNVVVEGRLQVRTWVDNSGNNRRNAEIIADSVYFADSKPFEGGSAPQTSDYPNSYEQTAPAPSGGFQEIEDSDGDLPFN